MTGWERTLAEGLFDGAVRLAVVVFVAEIVTRRLVRGAPGAVHTIWRIVAGSALLIPAIVAIVPATVFIQPSASALRLVNDAGQSNAVRLAVFAALSGTAFGVCRLLVGLVSMSALVRRSRLLSGDDERQLLSEAAGSETSGTACRSSGKRSGCGTGHVRLSATLRAAASRLAGMGAFEARRGNGPRNGARTARGLRRRPCRRVAAGGLVVASRSLDHRQAIVADGGTGVRCTRQRGDRSGSVRR